MSSLSSITSFCFIYNLSYRTPSACPIKLRNQNPNMFAYNCNLWVAYYCTLRVILPEFNKLHTLFLPLLIWPVIWHFPPDSSGWSWLFCKIIRVNLSKTLRRLKVCNTICFSVARMSLVRPGHEVDLNWIHFVNGRNESVLNFILITTVYKPHRADTWRH